MGCSQGFPIFDKPACRRAQGGDPSWKTEQNTNRGVFQWCLQSSGGWVLLTTCTNLASASYSRWERKRMQDLCTILGGRETYWFHWKLHQATSYNVLQQLLPPGIGADLKNPFTLLAFGLQRWQSSIYAIIYKVNNQARLPELWRRHR